MRSSSKSPSRGREGEKKSPVKSPTTSVKGKGGGENKSKSPPTNNKKGGSNSKKGGDRRKSNMGRKGVVLGGVNESGEETEDEAVRISLCIYVYHECAHSHLLSHSHHLLSHSPPSLTFYLYSLSLILTLSLRYQK